MKRNVSNIYLVVIPLFFLFITTRLKILDPRNDGWLSEGDGTYELAWEFYRNTPFPLWLVGNLDSYGSDMARPAFYLLPTFYSFPSRFFSFLMGERFQFIGLVLLLNLVLHFYFSSKIFNIFKFTSIQNLLSSTLLLTAPILHYRYIDHTHYLLNSNWIILLLFYLVLRKDTSWIKWSFLIFASLTIFPYYSVFVGSVGLVFFVFLILKNQISISRFISLSFSAIVVIMLALTISGYIFFGNVLQKDTDLIFASNLNSLIDPSGWSRVISDRIESEGNYEGFGFLGLNFLILVIIALSIGLYNKLFSTGVADTYSNSFVIILIPSFLLAVISLSRNIYWDGIKIFEIDSNWIYKFFELNFRSLGRFIWLLVYLIMIYALYKIYRGFKGSTFTWILIGALTLGIFDTLPKLTSQADERFSLSYENPLRSKFWSEISKCYETIVSVPTVTTASQLFPLAKIAYPQKLNIYPALIPRVSPDENFFMHVATRQNIYNGIFDESSIYVFQSAEFIIDAVTEKDKNIAINTMPPGSRAGNMNNVFVIAPKFESCPYLFDKYSNKLSISKQYNYKLSSTGNFNSSTDNSINLINGWSPPEEDGVWTIDDRSGVLIQRDVESSIDSIKLTGDRFIFPDDSSPSFEILVNGKSKLIISGKTKQNSFILPLTEEEKSETTFYIDFKFKNLKTPRELFSVEDDRKLGFKLKSISFI